MGAEAPPLPSWCRPNSYAPIVFILENGIIVVVFSRNFQKRTLTQTSQLDLEDGPIQRVNSTLLVGVTKASRIFFLRDKILDVTKRNVPIGVGSPYLGKRV